jgi:hypothetical protein
MALIIDSAGVLALADISRTVLRVPVAWAIFLDICVLGLACGSIFAVILDDWSLGDDPNPPINGYPWMDSEDIAIWCMVAIT